MRIMISCGEASGDLYAGALAAELRARAPSVEIVGFGGPRLKAAGATLTGEFTGSHGHRADRALRVMPRSWRMYRRLVHAGAGAPARRVRGHRFSRLQLPADDRAAAARRPDRLLRESSAVGVAAGSHEDDEAVRRQGARHLSVRSAALRARRHPGRVRRTSARGSRQGDAAEVRVSVGSRPQCRRSDRGAASRQPPE